MNNFKVGDIVYYNSEIANPDWRFKPMKVVKVSYRNFDLEILKFINEGFKENTIITIEFNDIHNNKLIKISEIPKYLVDN